VGTERQTNIHAYIHTHNAYIYTYMHTYMHVHTHILFVKQFQKTRHTLTASLLTVSCECAPGLKRVATKKNQDIFFCIAYISTGMTASSVP